jgi:hypothetical protein
MSKINNSNYNKISVKTDSMVKMIEQLSKLGVFKEKRKSRAKKTSVPGDEIKQDSDMVGYVKTLAGQAGRGVPNLFTLRQIEPGMTQQQIADIEKRNAAGIAILNAEIQQQRLADIEAQQRQRFADISMITGIDNPVLSRFRGAQEPGAGQRPSSFIQSTTIEEIEPDVNEGTFTQSLNEGGPKQQAVEQQTSLYAIDDEESENIPTKPSLQPREPIKEGGGAVLEEVTEEEIKPKPKTKKSSLVLSPQDISDDYGLGPLPKQSDNVATIRNYYIRLTDALGEPESQGLTKKELLDEIKFILTRAGDIFKK